jgi:ubiquinone/menaquinone biosynthesis C-methylase UbiE
MTSTSIYDSARLARSYAHARPPVHQHVVEAIRRRLRPGGGTFDRALDVGCGAGLSTSALRPIAARRVGLEPVRTMLRHCRDVAPGASFVAGRAEDLPFADGSFDLITAAGSLNYADLDRFLPAATRVMNDRGILLVYDFSSGRRLAGDDRLDRWFASFERRYPFPPGYAMDIRAANLAGAHLRLDAYEVLEVAVPMTLASYVAYALSETNVELAVSAGTSEEGIREWCEAALGAIFGRDPKDVLFDAYLAVICRA